MSLIENLHNNLIFYPTKEIFSTPSRMGIGYEEVFIDTEDGEKLYGYFLAAKEKTNKVFIYLHGNAQNVGDWWLAPAEIQKYININALLIDYRGYGKSTGTPSIEGANLDAMAMHNYLLIERDFKPENISIYGRSMGGAIGIELATKVQIKSITVQSSFLSLRKIAKDLYPLIPEILVQGKHWDSEKLIKNIKVPILISHGDKDEIIPVSHSYELYKLANEPKKLIILKGSSHNDVSSYFNNEYFETLNELLLK